jgi:hydrogenase maturation protease
MSLNGDKSKEILVIGIGNPLRCDDGVGPYVAGRIEAKGLKNVKVWLTQQLQLENLERMLEYDRVILVDASMAGPPVDFRQVESLKGQALSSSHHLSPETFVDLAQSIYHKNLNLHLCSIKGNYFEVGDKISSDVLERAQEAMELICMKVILQNK